MKNQDMRLYLAGDMLLKASQLLRAEEKRLLQEKGLADNLYNPMDAEFNDKEKNKNNSLLCDAIVMGDTNAIEWSNRVIIEPTSNALGTTVELGQVFAYNKMNDYIRNILDDESLRETDKLAKLRKMIDVDIPKKTVYAQYNDVRRHDAPECGDFRSWGVNQYVYGVVRALTDNRGFQEFEEIVENLVDEKMAE